MGSFGISTSFGASSAARAWFIGPEPAGSLPDLNPIAHSRANGFGSGESNSLGGVSALAAYSVVAVFEGWIIIDI
jgi:hypothetical protein